VVRSPVRVGRIATSLAGLAATLAITGSVPLGVLAASPSPTSVGGDTRSGGEGPGLVGDPLGAIALVVAIAVVSVIATMAYVRLTAGRSRSDSPGG